MSVDPTKSVVTKVSLPATTGNPDDDRIQVLVQPGEKRVEPSIEPSGTAQIKLVANQGAKSEVKFNSTKAFISRLVDCKFTVVAQEFKNPSSPVEGLPQEQLSLFVLVYLKDKTDRGEDVSVELSKLPPEMNELFLEIKSLPVERIPRSLEDRASSIKIPPEAIDKAKLNEWVLLLKRDNIAEEMAGFVDNVLPIINPDGRDLTVYYYAAGSDLARVLASTDATRLVFSDLSRHPMKDVDSRVDYFKEIIEQIENMGGKITYQYVTEKPSELTGVWARHRELDFQTAIDKAKPDNCDDKPFEFTLRKRLYTAREVSQDKFEVRSADGLDSFLLMTGLHNLAINQIDGSEFPEGVVPRAFQDEKHSGTLHVKFLLPSVSGIEKERELIYRLGDATKFVPPELEQGYDVLWSTDYYVFTKYQDMAPEMQSTRESLIGKLKSGGKVVSRAKNSGNIYRGSILDYKHGLKFETNSENANKLVIAEKVS